MDHLIAKYLSGEATDSEKEELHVWLKGSEESRQRFSQLQNLWQVANPTFDPESINVEQARQAFFEQIGLNKRKTFKYYINIMQRVAAILFLPLLLLLGYQLFENSWNLTPEFAYQEVSSPFGGRSKLVLPDGTRVWLNSGSKLKYPLSFSKQERRLQLQGEAYFEVNANKKRPFIVETRDLNVCATGTAFNVMAFECDSIVGVTLIHGKVAVTDQLNRKTIMKPSDNLIYNRLIGQTHLKQVNVYKYESWKDGILVFRNEPLDEVLKRLGQIYNVNLELKNNEFSKVKLRATFENESLDEVLGLIMKTTSLSYTRSRKIDKSGIKYQKEKIIIMK